MAKAIMVVMANAAEGREAEFVEWYDKIHMPDVLETPGFVRGTRYELGTRYVPAEGPSAGQGQFMILYELEGDDTEAAWAALRENLQKKYQQGRHSDSLRLQSLGFYKPVVSQP